MDGLRELFGAPLAAAKDGSPLDQLGNRFSDLLVRFTRDLAWDAAMEVWRSDDRPAGRAPNRASARRRRGDRRARSALHALTTSGPKVHSRRKAGCSWRLPTARN